jgi:hypothetical protein
MKTRPILRPDGTVFAFEIPKPFTTWGLIRFLRTVEGVSAVKVPRGLTHELRLAFRFHGEPFVVEEPYGDNDRYWIGPENPRESRLDMTLLHQAFEAHRGTALWRWTTDLDDYDYAAPWEPVTAFAAAVVGCFAYFSLPDGLMRMVSPPVPALALLVLPVVCCGLFGWCAIPDCPGYASGYRLRVARSSRRGLAGCSLHT